MIDDVPDPSWGDLPAADWVGGDGGRARYEDQAVRRLCALLGHPEVARTVAQEAAARTGRALASFALFDALVAFPVRLRTGPLRGIRWLSVPDLFNRLERTPIGTALAAVAEEVDPATGALGLVFRWPGEKDAEGRTVAVKGGKFMVAHTFPTGTSFAHRATQVVRPFRLEGVDVVVTLETLDHLATAFRGWQPLWR